tara:strand:+ start:1407 stop:2549 length:1143 start_codon:yes stop_codon:yes gene_type:complete
MALENIRARWDQVNQQRTVNFDNAFWGDVGSFVKSDLGDYNANTKSIVFPTQLMPDKTSLWNKYNELAKKRGVNANYSQFMQNYDQVKMVEDRKFLEVLNKTKLLGGKDKAIRTALNANPEALARVNNIFSMSDPATQATMVDMLKPKTTLMGIAEDNPLKAGALGVGTLLGTGYLGAKGASKAIDFAKERFGSKAVAEDADKTTKGKGKGKKSAAIKDKVMTMQKGISTKDMDLKGIKGVPEYIDRKKLNTFVNKQYDMAKGFHMQDNPKEPFMSKKDWRKGKDTKYFLKQMSSDEIKQVAGKRFKNVPGEQTRTTYGPKDKSGKITIPKDAPKSKSFMDKAKAIGKKGLNPIALAKRNPITALLLAAQAAQMFGSNEE